MENQPVKPIKGILKKNHQTQRSNLDPRLKWDEANLELTEAQKDAVMKVDEPKTPYIHYNPETDEVLNMPEGGYDIKAAHEEPEEFSLDTGNESDRSSTSSSRKGRRVYLSDDDWDSDDKEEDEQTRKQHDEFAKKRAMHYNMGNVLRNDDDENEDKEARIPPVPVGGVHSNGDLMEE
ncbi:hypothetical protein BDF14DRAFT_1741406 [Spinellus fusiger]|nr:hypothetical protein BDF14DRAFT_1741406 [Spinellus fusiger]